ncbi:calmodulin-like protein 3 isoform X1 [Cynara cardunculus var. scolymus]|uniref:Calcium-binding EF-hand n=1 Tax=Cynara cardunculus var. scolymus TaxID=59895 RepID=A0A124SCL5_CYNCS|nr:calmodulin-like protein 3 isoform X1 [Cynara cardunculus var. scolymus]KVH94180.1 Calcium-binding EF-hand [Cynara cardunculus var. scolymus]
MDLSEIHHLFQMFDHNGDGKITTQELTMSLENLGINIPEDDLGHMIDHIDTNGDGSVNMEEFRGLYETIMEEWDEEEEIQQVFYVFHEAIMQERDEEEDIREAFNVFDKNGDGFISVDELTSVLSSLGLRQGRTIDECWLMIKMVDEDGDGVVDFGEFRKMMRGGTFAALQTS